MRCALSFTVLLCSAFYPYVSSASAAGLIGKWVCAIPSAGIGRNNRSPVLRLSFFARDHFVWSMHLLAGGVADTGTYRYNYGRLLLFSKDTPRSSRLTLHWLTGSSFRLHDEAGAPQWRDLLCRRTTH